MDAAGSPAAEPPAAGPPAAANGSELRRASLPGGGVLVIRRTHPGDREQLRALFAALDVADDYARFFSAFRPDDEFLERLAGGNQRGACQLVATIDSTIVGEAGAWPLPNGNGELGITVARGHRGWLGAFLLDTLLDTAARAGIPNVEAEVLVTNRPMLALLRERGYAVIGGDEWRTLRVVISTSGSTPTWAPNDDRPRVLIEVPGGRWTPADVDDGGGKQVIGCPGPAARSGRHPCPALEGEPCPLAVGADVILVHLTADETRAKLIDAHDALHPGVPVCLGPPG